ncbi:hypothetical protein [Streptomyces lydicus]|uniref:hypothetical protein n=1 Tax=Streptomyces lydicus TaxID=47763 RepID=UPI003441A4E0
MAVVMEADLTPAGGTAPDRPVMQTSAALVADGEDIARARRLAADFRCCPWPGPRTLAESDSTAWRS